MGNASSSSSSRMEHTALVPQLRFPRVVNARFVRPQTATLRVPFGVFAAREPLAIVDEETGDVAFQVRASRSTEGAADHKPLMLLDKNAVPVAALEGYPVGEDYAMYVAQRPMATAVGRGLGNNDSDAAPAAWNESRVLCYLQANTRPMEKRMLIEVEDPVTREPLQVRVEGSWPKHEAIFWLHRGRQCECIARVYVDPYVRQSLREAESKRKHQNKAERTPPSDATEQDPQSQHYYCVGVAPGVDMALIVLACAAMDGELAKKESGEKVVVPTDDPITKMLAQRHYCTGDRNRTHSRTFITAGFVMGT